MSFEEFWNKNYSERFGTADDALEPYFGIASYTWETAEEAAKKMKTKKKHMKLKKKLRKKARRWIKRLNKKDLDAYPYTGKELEKAYIAGAVEN